MSRESLAVKFRPRKFSEVVEQTTIKQILQRQIETNNLKRVLLFTGGAGTGKTTNARIFANEIEPVRANIIEMNAADHTGVDDMRLIIDQCKSKPLQGNYKIFIIDECFTGNTLISTNYGEKCIKDIKPGDCVKTLTGLHKVTHVHENNVSTYDNLVLIKLRNRQIITTKNHLVFTNSGWIPAGKLIKGDLLYDTDNVSKLWKDLPEKIPGSDVLLSPMLSGIPCKKIRSKTSNVGNTGLHNLWETVSDSKTSAEQNVFEGMFFEVPVQACKGSTELRIRHGITETVIRKNVEKQPNEQSRNNCKNVRNQEDSWKSTYMEGEEGWKWSLLNSSDEIIRFIREWLDFGISNSDRMSSFCTPISYVLQSRPWISNEEVSDRGGWQRPQIERFTIEGCQENGLSNEFRVESVEIYKRGNNEKLFSSSFTDSELSEDYVKMYDLTIEGDDPTYFANGVLVHNCHQLTPQAQNSLLKILEEPPSYCIFILCTTDPQKILGTILSRAYRYDFQLISAQGIVDRLNFILNSEKADPEGYDVQTWDQPALYYLARNSKGHLRDAITLLDKTLSYTSNVNTDAVIQVLGVTSYDIMFELLFRLRSKDIEALTSSLEQLKATGKNLKLFVKDFLSFLLDVNKYTLFRNYDYIDIPNTYEDKLNQITQNDKQLLRNLIQTFIKLNTDIKWETNPAILLESTLLLEVM